jgi:carbamoyltransferase
MYYLGVNAFSHHSSAAIVSDAGELIAAVEEERYSRVKEESRFPIKSIRYCLQSAGVEQNELAGIAMGWSPRDLFFSRLIRSQIIEYPVKMSTLRATGKQLRDLLLIRSLFEHNIGHFTNKCTIIYYRHHIAHASSAFFSSPFDEAAYLTIDGRGERQTITWGVGTGKTLSQFGAHFFPHSIGKLYSAISRYLGFYGPERAGTVMALAAHGSPTMLDKFSELVRWIPGKHPNTLRLNLEYFNLGDIALTSAKIEKLLGQPARQANGLLSSFHEDVAATLQYFSQGVVLSLAKWVRKVTKMDRLVMAGGVALNTVTNALVVNNAGFRDVFIQPASHDGGLSLGAAQMLAAHNSRQGTSWYMNSAAVGPEFGNAEIETAAKINNKVCIRRVSDISAEAAIRIHRGEIVGWFQGRLEFGPRALGQRCLLADPRRSGMKNRLNRIKVRESFRPFGGAILADHRHDWLQNGYLSAFMLMVDQIKKDRLSQIPALLHIDNSVRYQTVEAHVLPDFYKLIEHFMHLSNVPWIISTSLNIKGEPLACTPEDAIRVLVETELDALIIGSFILIQK